MSFDPTDGMAQMFEEEEVAAERAVREQIIDAELAREAAVAVKAAQGAFDFVGIPTDAPSVARVAAALIAARGRIADQVDAAR